MHIRCTKGATPLTTITSTSVNKRRIDVRRLKKKIINQMLRGIEGEQEPDVDRNLTMDAKQMLDDEREMETCTELREFAWFAPHLPKEAPVVPVVGSLSDDETDDGEGYGHPESIPKFAEVSSPKATPVKSGEADVATVGAGSRRLPADAEATESHQSFGARSGARPKVHPTRSSNERSDATAPLPQKRTADPQASHRDRSSSPEEKKYVRMQSEAGTVPKRETQAASHSHAQTSAKLAVSVSSPVKSGEADVVTKTVGAESKSPIAQAATGATSEQRHKKITGPDYAPSAPSASATASDESLPKRPPGLIPSQSRPKRSKSVSPTRTPPRGRGRGLPERSQSK